MPLLIPNDNRQEMWPKNQLGRAGMLHSENPFMATIPKLYEITSIISLVNNFIKSALLQEVGREESSSTSAGRHHGGHNLHTKGFNNGVGCRMTLTSTATLACIVKIELKSAATSNSTFQ